jgi:hypothetical protein
MALNDRIKQAEADMLAQQMLAIGNRPSTRSQQPAPARSVKNVVA